jgi:hypothetical protein
MKSRHIKFFSRTLCEFKGNDNRNEYNWNNVKVGGIIFA